MTNETRTKKLRYFNNQAAAFREVLDSMNYNTALSNKELIRKFRDANIFTFEDLLARLEKTAHQFLNNEVFISTKGDRTPPIIESII